MPGSWRTVIGADMDTGITLYTLFGIIIYVSIFTDAKSSCFAVFNTFSTLITVFSEMEKLDQGQAVLQDTTALGLGASKNGHILERKVR